MLTTIISRTQRFPIPLFTDQEIIEHLKAEQGVLKEGGAEIAMLAQGNMKKAISLAKSAETDDHDWFAQWMRFVYAFDLASMVQAADEFDAFSKEKQKDIIDYSLSIFREIFLFASGNENFTMDGNNQIQ